MIRGRGSERLMIRKSLRMFLIWESRILFSRWNLVMSSISFRDSSNRLRFTSIMRRKGTWNYNYKGERCQGIGLAVVGIRMRYQVNEKGVN